jgi:hypothetical protein
MIGQPGQWPAKASVPRLARGCKAGYPFPVVVAAVALLA